MNTAITVQDIFTLENIAQIYEDRIRPKSGRGIDRISVVDFDKKSDEHFAIIKDKCINASYRFSPYLQRLILKGPQKPPRSISIPTIRDKIVLAILNIALQKAFPDSVLRELPNVKVRKLAQSLSNNTCGNNLHRIDIETYYDSINTKRLISIVRDSSLDNTLTQLIHRAIKNPTVPESYHRKDRNLYINKDDKGVPQGLPISNILAEIFLGDTDKKLSPLCDHYDRYVDDIVAITRQDVDFQNLCETEFKAKGLTINNEKTNFCCEKDHVQFLGYTLSNSLISVKRSNFERHLHSISMMFVRLRKAIYIDKKKKEKQIGTTKIKRAFLEDLNVKIAGAKFQNKRYGWLQYFSEIDDETIPHLIDNFVRAQFKRCKIFSEIPNSLKKATRAYYELKHNWQETKYLFDYEQIDFKNRRQWLSDRGLALGMFSKDEIDRLYVYHVGRFLNQIEKDLGVAYKI